MTRSNIHRVREAIAIHEEPYNIGRGAREKSILSYLEEEYEVDCSEAENLLKKALMEGECYQPDGERYRVI